MRLDVVLPGMSLITTVLCGCTTTPFVRASATDKPDIYRIYSNIAALRAVDARIEHEGSSGANEAAIAIASAELRKQSNCSTGVELYNPAHRTYPVARLERSNDVLYLVRCTR